MTPSDLKSWRAALDLTQAGAAEALGVPKRTYEGWEAGRTPTEHPSLLTLACEAVKRRRKRKTPPTG